MKLKRINNTVIDVEKVVAVEFYPGGVTVSMNAGHIFPFEDEAAAEVWKYFSEGVEFIGGEDESKSETSGAGRISEAEVDECF